MKKILLFAMCIAVCFLAITGCGKAGKAYLQVTWDTGNANYWIAHMEGFPDSWSMYTDYEMTEGTYSGGYVLCYDYYSSPYYYSEFNDAYYAGYNTVLYNGSSYSTNHSYYVSTYYNYYYNPISVDITTNPGAFPLKAGADKYFTLYLGWSYFSISSNAVPAADARVIENSADRVVKELTDGAYTIRVTMQKKGTPRGANSVPDVRQGAKN